MKSDKEILDELYKKFPSGATEERKVLIAYKEGFNRDEYLKRLLSENMDYHNKNVFYKIVLDKHNLLGEAESLMNEALGMKEEQNDRD